MKYLFLFLLFFSFGVAASPFIVSSPFPAGTSPMPTSCGLYLDSQAKVTSPTVTDSSGTYCHIDIASVAVGQHAVKVTSIVNDPNWGTLESGTSGVLNFQKPAIPPVPTGISISPN